MSATPPRRPIRPTALLSIRYRDVADLVRAGHRETPQRFRPLAWRLARAPGEGGRIWSLFDDILRSLLAEFRQDPGRPTELRTLIDRVRLLVEEHFDWQETFKLYAEVVALAPHRRRRRSIHCHGEVAPDRVLLVLRTMLPPLAFVAMKPYWPRTDAGTLAWSIENIVAYYVADYDRDHFVMTGPAVAERFWLIALWCQGNMPGDGLDSLRR